MSPSVDRSTVLLALVGLSFSLRKGDHIGSDVGARFLRSAGDRKSNELPMIRTHACTYYGACSCMRDGTRLTMLAFLIT
jgi:hypothetical protein